MLLEIRDGSAGRNGTPILSHFSFEIRGTEKIAVVGRNGAGKTTLLQVLAGQIELETNEKNPESGMIQSRAFTIGMLEQQVAPEPEKTVEELFLQAILTGRETGFRMSPDFFQEEQRYHRMLTRLGFSLDDKNKKIKEFSGGEQTKIMLIRFLLARPDVLILDEPTNHLDLESTEWLEKWIRAYPKAVVMVSHDRYFLDRTADVTWEVTGKRLVRYAGNYTAYVREKADRYARQLKKYEQQQEEIRREKELILKFKNRPRKAAFARSRKKLLERMERVEKPDPDDAVIHTGDFFPARPGSKWVYQCEHLVTGYEKEHPLQELTLRIRRGQKIGILGSNGSGKSTFLKTLVGRLQPLEGKQSLGTHVDTAYFDQMTADIQSELTVLEWFREKYPALTEKELRSILAGYLFRGRDTEKKVSHLSGGEKSRLVLASLMQSRPNFLVLDEPTNNMDIPARETLESVFRCFRGTILFISHDRYFLDKVADSLLLFQPGSRTVNYYPFGYTHYRERLAHTADGQDVAALRSTENQRLIEDLKAVPKAEHFRLKEFSTEEATRDWRFGLNRKEREKAEEEFCCALQTLEKQRENELREFAEKLSCPGNAFGKRKPEEEEAEKSSSSGTEDPKEKLTEQSYSDLEIQAEMARRRWTETCLDWYEIWLDTPLGRTQEES